MASTAVFGLEQMWAAGKMRGNTNTARANETMKLPFKLSVITDEISQDFGHAAEIAAQEFGLGYIEIRTLWKKNIVNLDDKELAEVRRIVDKHQLKVTDIGSPLFKIAWPGAPKSKYDEGTQYGASFTFEKQDEVLDRAMAAGKGRERCGRTCHGFSRLAC